MVSAVSNGQNTANNPYLAALNGQNQQSGQANQGVVNNGSPNDPMAIINSIAGISSNENSQAVTTRLANPEKIDNLRDLKQAVKAGQITEVKAWDENAVANWQNDKSHYVIKFKTDSNKWGSFEVGNFVNPKLISELQQICIEKGVKFKSPKSSPVLDNLNQALIQSAPGVAAVVLSIAGFVGMRKYSLWRFESRVRDNLINRPTEILDSKDVIDINDIRKTLIGMPEGMYGRWEGLWEYIDEVKAGKDKIRLDDRRLSVVLAGMPGCGKSVFNLNALYHVLNELNGENGKPKVLAVRIDNLEKEQSKLEQFFGIGARDQKAEIISRVLKEQGADIGILYSDDPKDPKGMMKLFKGVYDITDQDGRAGADSKRNKKGFVGKVKQFFGFGSADSGKLASVHLQMTTNSSLPQTDDDDHALNRRVNYPERILSFTTEERMTQLKHFISKEYSINEDDVPADLLVALGNETIGDEDEKAANTFVPVTYKEGLMQIIKRVCMPTSNPNQNKTNLEKLGKILSADPAHRSHTDQSVYNKVFSYIVSVTGKSVPLMDDIQAQVQSQVASLLGGAFSP